MKIQDLLLCAAGPHVDADPLEMDPLTEEDALQEAQLLGVRFDALSLTAGLIFELRPALQLRQANTGVLIARGVLELAWSGPSRETELTAWTVGGSVPRHTEQNFSLKLGLWPAPGAQLSLVSESAEFFVGDVPGLAAVPPDYGEIDRTAVGTTLVGWESEFLPLHAVFLDPARRN